MCSNNDAITKWMTHVAEPADGKLIISHGSNNKARMRQGDPRGASFNIPSLLSSPPSALPSQSRRRNRATFHASGSQALRNSLQGGIEAKTKQLATVGVRQISFPVAAASTWRTSSRHPLPVFEAARLKFITFRVRHSRGVMYIGHGRLSVCPSPRSNTTEWTMM